MGKLNNTTNKMNSFRVTDLFKIIKSPNTNDKTPKGEIVEITRAKINLEDKNDKKEVKAGKKS